MTTPNVTPNITCEEHPDRLAGFTVDGAPLCYECLEHPNVKCPNCGFRQHGRYQNNEGQIGCSRCNHVWLATD